MKIKLIVFFICLSTLSGFAQNISVKGRIVENVNEQITSIRFATISLMKSDSTIVTSTSSGEDGTFALNGIEKGDYLLSVSLIGYTPTGIVLKNLTKLVDLSDIEIEESSIALREVIVSANNIIHKIDRQIILPTENQIKHSYDAYDLLNNMMIARLNVNPIVKVMEVSGGGVQARINGIKVSDKEIASIRAKDIIRVEFIEDPGKQYGDENLGAVVNIIVRRQESGGIINAQTNTSPYVLNSENFLSAKFNYKKSEWGINVVNLNKGYKKGKRDVNETYYLDDKIIERVQEGINDKRKRFSNYINLSYNLYESDKYTFNAVLRNNIENTPYDNRSNKLYDKQNIDNFIFSKTKNNSSSYSPSLDLYYQHILPHSQSLEVNIIGTLINTDGKRNYREYTPDNIDLTDIQTNVDGKKRSIIGEVIYDKELKNIKISTGARHSQMRTENEYTGSNPIVSDMDQSQSSAFIELQGKVKNFSYTGSLGGTRSWFKEGNEDHQYYIFSPTVRLSFVPHKNGYLHYRFNIDPSIPALSSLTDVEQALDTIQIVRGNPRLKTYKIYNNSLNYSYQLKKFQGNMNIKHQYYDNPIMESVFVENNKLIMMDENQCSFQRLNFELNMGLRSLDVASLKEFLSLQVVLGYTSFQSKGNLYKHKYDNFYYSIQAFLSYKKLMFAGIFQKNQDALYGETISKGTNMTAFMLIYNHKNLQVGSGIYFPFTNNYRTGSERLSTVAPVKSWDYVKESGRLFKIRIAYNFEFGRKYKAGNKNLDNADTDTGIINTNR